MDFYTELENVISDMPRIGLEETGKVRLMNRTDRKYLANRNLLLKFLRLTKDEYSILWLPEALYRFIPQPIGIRMTISSIQGTTTVVVRAPR